MKKKLFSLALALALCLGLAVPAFAAGDTVSVTDAGISFDAISTSKYDNAKDELGYTGPEAELLYALGMVGAQFAEDDYGYGTLWAYLVHDDVKLDFHVKKGEKFSITGYYLTNKRGGGEGSSVFYDSIFIRDLWFSPREDDSDPVDKEFIDEYFPGANYLVCCQGQEYDFDSTIRIVLSDENGEPRTVPGFSDVKPTDYYAAPVAYAVVKNITNGTSTTTFSPSQNCTQAQILTFLYRTDWGEGAATAEDMDKAISWAREEGMIDDSFDGSTPCTRSTAVSYIWQAFDKPTAEASSFTDVPASADYAKAVDWAVEMGITKGDGSDTIFSPEEVCNRGQIVTFLYRAYKR